MIPPKSIPQDKKYYASKTKHQKPPPHKTRSWRSNYITNPRRNIPFPKQIPPDRVYEGKETTQEFNIQNDSPPFC